MRALPREVTVVVVEHDFAFVSAVADTVTVLQDGKLLATGTPAEIAADAAVRAAYLGEAGMGRSSESGLGFGEGDGFGGGDSGGFGGGDFGRGDDTDAGADADSALDSSSDCPLRSGGDSGAVEETV